MKELNNQERLNEKTGIEQVQKKTQEVEFKYDSSLRPMKGHKVWEINTRDGSIKEAEYIKHKDLYWFDAIRGIENGWREDVVKNKHCIYISALNKQTALKRWKSGKGSAKIGEGTRNINSFI